MRTRTFIAVGIMAIASATSACSSSSGEDGDALGERAPGADAIAIRGVVTSLSVTREDNKPIDKFMTHHPIRVSMSIRPTGPMADHVVHVGLVEKVGSDVPRNQARTCFLGAIDALYGIEEGQEAKEITLTRDFVVSPGCLGNASEE